jgi:hypothetical protein
LFISNKSEQLRAHLAENKNLNKDSMIILSTDAVWSVRAAVLANEKTPLSILTALSQDKVDWIKKNARLLSFKMLAYEQLQN